MPSQGSPHISLVSSSESFYRWEYDWIRWLLSDFKIEALYDPDFRSAPEFPILVLSGELHGKERAIEQYLFARKRRGRGAGLIHLSDEFLTAPTQFYPAAAFVFRNYFRPEAIDGSHCRYLPLGYTNGMPASVTQFPRPMHERKFTWCFAGEPKRTRRRMLAAAHRIPGGNIHLTSQWEDARALSRADYAQLLADSVFALCPAGNSSADTFRLYEALEAGAIPIVEDAGGLRAWKETLFPASLLRVSPWTDNRWRSCCRKLLTPSYWNQAYPAGFPCPRLCHWENLEDTIRNLHIKELSAQIRNWWQTCKQTHRYDFARTIQSAFAIEPRADIRHDQSDQGLAA